jgi:phosphopantetheinyl transferase (holo-ACP synthase)
LPYVGNDVVDLREPANAGKSRNSRFLKKILTNAEIEFVQNAKDPDATLWSLWACKETAYKVIKKYCLDAAFLPRQWTVIFNPARLGIPRLQPGEECAVTRGRSRYPHASRDNSTCKLQFPLFLKLGSHYYREPPASAGGGSTKFQPDFSDGEVMIPGKGIIYVRLFSNLHYVHCVGADCLAALDKLIWKVDVLPEEKDEKNINPSFFSRNCLGQNLAQYFSLNFHNIKIKRASENGELQPPRVYVSGRKTNIDISLIHDGRFVDYAYHL